MFTGSLNAHSGTPEPAQVKGLGSWTTLPVLTIGETLNGYTPPGSPDGLGAFERQDTVEILSNHELKPTRGYRYTLANGTRLRGARISRLLFDKTSREILDMGLAYDTIRNRNGEPVSDSNPLETGAGLKRLCSAGAFRKGQAGFVDDVFLTGEEARKGTAFALDVANNVLWAVPLMGRAAWEGITALDIPALNRTHVIIVAGDDRADAALLLYLGKKHPGGSFLERNGLADGSLYMWVSDNGDLSPADWYGRGHVRRGRFVRVSSHVAMQPAGAQGDYDELGFATQGWLDEQKERIGAFRFSRPEDVHTDPQQGNRFVLASTGRHTTINQGKDRWGTLYIADVKVDHERIRTGNIEADIVILYDGDEAENPDLGLRNPDNLVWADDGYIYAQEDRSFYRFGRQGGGEAKIWQLDPVSGHAKAVGQVDRNAIPDEQYDRDPEELGKWETSGIIDVTDAFDAEGERLLLFNVQAHSLRGGSIGNADLVQGGQYLFLSKPEQDAGKNGHH